MSIDHNQVTNVLKMLVSFKSVPSFADALIVHKLDGIPLRQKNPLGEAVITSSKWSKDGTSILATIKNIPKPKRSCTVKMFFKSGKLYILDTNKKGTVNTKIFKRIE